MDPTELAKYKDDVIQINAKSAQFDQAFRLLAPLLLNPAADLSPDQDVLLGQVRNLDGARIVGADAIYHDKNDPIPIKFGKQEILSPKTVGTELPAPITDLDNSTDKKTFVDSVTGLPKLDDIPKDRPTKELQKKAEETQAPTDLNNAGKGYLKDNQPQLALKDYTQTIKTDPNNKDAREGMVQAKLAMGDRDGAAADAKKLLALDPKNQLAQLVVGHGDSISQGGSRMKLKADFGSRGDADAGTASGPAAGWGAAGSRQIQATTANQGFGPGSGLTMSPAQSLISQALEKLRMGDVTGAIMSARQAVDADPKNATAWAALAEISNQAGNAKGALEAANKALALDPVNPQALRAKAYAEIQLGNFADAYQDALRATQLDPQNGLGFLYLAMAEEKLGRTADALKHYEQSVSLDTTLDPLVQEARKRLGGGSATGLTPAAKQHLVRGGAIAGGLVLILLGLLGTAAGKRLTTTAKRLAAAKEGESATVLDEARTIGAGSLLGGNFRVTGELGRGGMGIVYDATDETLRRRVAIKQLQRDGSTTSEDRERFLKEARLVASLKHPHLAQIYSVINEEELYLVFEYVDGEALDKTLARGGKIPLPQARRLLSEIASALDYAHAQKVIHRDLKPSNIMIAKDGSAKVMDFGIAHQSQNATAATKTSASGTPPYMAPEQAFGSVSKASDLYALAVLAYEMLTGSRPFDGPDYLEQKLQKRFSPPSQREASLRRDLDAFFARALDPDPTKRPPDAKNFLRAFDEACAALGKPV